jgi:hypothetical protein
VNVTENVCLAYFADRAADKKNIDLNFFFKLTAFMKRQSAGYQCKKSKVSK